MRRRVVISSLCSTALVSAAARAQVQRRRFVAVLSPGADAHRPVFVAFHEAMATLGYGDGTGVAVEFHMAAGSGEQLSELARDLVRREADVIVADGGAATDAARMATTRIPIAAIIGGDPVARGIAAS